MKKNRKTKFTALAWHWTRYYEDLATAPPAHRFDYLLLVSLLDGSAT